MFPLFWRRWVKHVLGSSKRLSRRGIRPHNFRARLFLEQLESRLTPSLNPLVTETGFINLSVDGLGTNDSAGGTIRVQKPAGATVRSAFLAAAAVPGNGVPDGAVKIDGVGINWDITSTTSGSFTFISTWSNVTTLVKSKIDLAPAGLVNFHIDEVNTRTIDGEILAVVFNDPTQTTTNTIILLFGGQKTGGDNFSVGLGSPLDKSDPKLLLDFSLGISFGFQTPGNISQQSNVDVNGTRMSSAAGGADDGTEQDGALLTVGGIGDSHTNPVDPFYGANGSDPLFLGDRADDELYDLRPFVKTGDTSFQIHTINPSNDDNIFFAALNLHSVRAGIGGPPQPIGLSFGGKVPDFRSGKNGHILGFVPVFNVGATPITGDFNLNFSSFTTPTGKKYQPTSNKKPFTTFHVENLQSGHSQIVMIDFDPGSFPFSPNNLTALHLPVFGIYISNGVR